MKSLSKRKIKKVSTDDQEKEILVKALGKGARQQYLQDNPHGYSKVNKVHKSKKNYTRKSKHKGKDW